MVGLKVLTDQKENPSKSKYGDQERIYSHKEPERYISQFR